MRQSEPMKFRCPYCGTETTTEHFVYHCYQEHPEIQLPVPLTVEYIETRYASLGGLEWL